MSLIYQKFNLSRGGCGEAAGLSTELQRLSTRNAPRRAGPCSTSHIIRSKQMDPNSKDNPLIRKETSTCKGFHYTFAALFS